MGETEILEERKQLLEERYRLAMDRIRAIGTEETVQAPFSDYFRKTAEFLLLMEKLRARIEAGGLKQESLAELQEWNDRLYADILPGANETSYANPAYAVKRLGEDCGRLLSLLYTELRGMIVYAYEGLLEEQTVLAELFIEIYNRFEQEAKPESQGLEQSLYWFFSDYTDLFAARRVRELIDPSLDFAARIVMDSDLEDLRYLYAYGEYVSENERTMARFLNSLPEKTIAAMADTFTEGYRIGFAATGKDLSIKKRSISATASALNG